MNKAEYLQQIADSNRQIEEIRGEQLALGQQYIQENTTIPEGTVVLVRKPAGKYFNPATGTVETAEDETRLAYLSKYDIGNSGDIFPLLYKVNVNGSISDARDFLTPNQTIEVYKKD